MKSCTFVLAGLLIASPAFADCAGTHALDRCLVGTWNFRSGGSVEWMNRNIHMAHVTAVSHNGLSIVFRADGSFATSQIDVRSAVAANNGQVTGTGHATGQAAGQWSVAAGHFNLCPTASNIQTTITINMRGHPIHVTPHMPSAPSATNYTCNGTTLSTTQPIAGHEPILTVYSRAH